jgi:hypothetical protein
MKKILLAVALTAGFVVGCNEVEGFVPDQTNPEPIKIPIRLSSDISLRATDNNYETGDQVGIYVVNRVNGTQAQLANSNNHLDNTRFTYDGAQWNPDQEVYWKDQQTAADFYCYYPYRSTVSNVSALEFSVQEDQSSIDSYKASDLLYGKTLDAKPSMDPVNITTKHALSNVIVYVTPGKGYTQESLAAEEIDVLITGVKTKATLDLSSGAVSAAGESKDIIPIRENNYWRAIVVPQSLVGAQIIKVVVGPNVYNLNQTVTFESGKQHTCTLKVNKIGEGVNITIGGWENSGSDFGGTLE